MLRHASLAALMTLAIGCSSESETLTDGNDALVGGAVANEGQFPSSLLVRGSCTVTKVGSKHLLTAAHCTVDGGRPSSIYEAPFDVTTKPIALLDDPSFPWIRVSPVKVYRHPAVEAELTTEESISVWGFYPDISIVELDDESAERLKDIPIASIDVEPLTPAESVMIQGYGCEDGRNGALDSTKNRLKFHATNVAASPSSTSDENRDPDIETRQYFRTVGHGSSPDEASLCPGDSGGAVYRGRDPSRVVGINSRSKPGPNADARQIGATNYHTRLDASTQWDVAGWLATVPGITLSGPAPATAHFTECAMLARPWGGNVAVCGKIREAFEAAGGVTALGAPISPAGLDDPREGGTAWAQRFERAVIWQRGDETSVGD